MIFEAALTPNPVDAVAELLRQNQSLRVVVVTPGADEELTLDCSGAAPTALFRGKSSPSSGGVPAESCWGRNLARQSGRSLGHGSIPESRHRPAGSRPKVQLTPKETLIVSCVTQGMKNKEIALRVGTTEQVVKNYLRKVYDKLGVADRLELALYCLNHHVVDNTKVPPLPVSAANETVNNGGAANAAAAGASVSAGPSSSSASPIPANAAPSEKLS